jgi:hypothetical protein
MKLIAAFISGALIFSNAYAQTPETDIQTVKVTGVRDPAMMPYKEAYELLTRLKAIGDGRIDFVIRVISSKTKQPIPGLDLALSGENTYEKVPVSAEGRVDVPLIERAYADKAEFVTNQKKGTIAVEFFLVPKLPAEDPTYADVLASIDAGQRALKELIPWYVRLFIPRVKGVDICYPDNQRQVRIAGSRPGIRPAKLERIEYVGKEKSWCARFARADKDLDKDSVIVAPAGWKANYVQ